MKKLKTFMIGLLAVIFSIGPIKVYAEEAKLPSGILESELENQIRQYVNDHMETTAGMSYAVFNGNRDIAAGYFGYADKENDIKVDENTVFEWGSVSKLMVWISVMQLVEQGKIDLKEDVQVYLPKNTLKNLNFDTPITMLDLMNHSAGFQEKYTDLFVKDAKAYPTLEKALLAYQPAQIYEPGTMVAYSNWSTAFAAYIVEQVSGLDYVEYVHANIFKPLQMEHSAIAMDLSDNPWVADKRKELWSYSFSGKRLPDLFYYISLYPVGMCTSTLADFRTFAKALMDKNTVLFQNKETWEAFFTPTAYYSGTKIGRNYHGMWMVPFGVQTIGHGGNTAGCSSYLLMDIESGIGTVVMTNQAYEKVYNVEMMKLIYGEYEDAKYHIEKGDPQGIYKSARTFKVGPLKLLNMNYNGDQNEDDVFFVYNNQASSKKIEYPYLDFYEINRFEMIGEIALVGAFVLTFVISLVIMLKRGIHRLIRKFKKIPRVKGVAYIGIGFFIEVLIGALLAYGISGVSSYAPVISYQWVFAAIGILGILLLLSAGLGGYRTIRFKEGKKLYKAGNMMLIINGVLLVANILYWNLYMFWAL